MLDEAAEAAREIAHKVAAARTHDPRRTAVALASVILVLLADDPVAKIALAAALVGENAAELDDDDGRIYRRLRALRFRRYKARRFLH